MTRAKLDFRLCVVVFLIAFYPDVAFMIGWELKVKNVKSALAKILDVKTTLQCNCRSRIVCGMNITHCPC